MNEEITGTLEEWSYSDGMVWGRIYDDIKRRFDDGYYIHTSKVIKPESVVMAEGSIIYTRNSVYKLGKPEFNDTAKQNLLKEIY